MRELGKVISRNRHSRKFAYNSSFTMPKNRRFKFLGMSLSLGLVCAVLAACGNGSSASSTSSPSTSTSSKALGTCTATKNYHEYQFKNDATLKATFEDVAVAHLETNVTAPDDSRDSGTAGVDIIPYTVTDGPREITFTLNATTVSSAVIKDAYGSAVFTINKGDAPAKATLASGDYSLTLTSDNAATKTIFIMPDSCATGSTTAASVSAQANVSKSVMKAANYQTPGVYITEINGFSPTTIPTVSTDVTYIVGAASQGVVNTPTLITSWNQYQQVFGSPTTISSLDLAVYEFFASGGSSLNFVNVQTLTPANIIAAMNTISVTYFNLLVIPDLATMTQSDAITVLISAIPFATSKKAIMLVDYPTSIDTLAEITTFVIQLRNSVPSTIDNAALYFPAITVLNPVTQAFTTIGNGSTVAGVIAANDIAVGVWQAPAGEEFGRLDNVVSLPVPLSSTQLSSLTSLGINPIREILGVGTVIWGDSMLLMQSGTKTQNTYLSVRRTMTAVEQAMQTGTQWAVFEPNDDTTWVAVTSSISNYLNTLWQEGALFGATASEAYFVECGLGTTMTSTDILNGFMIVDAGIALVQPADFIDFQVEQEMQTSN